MSKIFEKETYKKIYDSGQKYMKTQPASRITRDTEIKMTNKMIVYLIKD